MIIPYKNRRINTRIPIRLYRNINRDGVWYSVLQKGLVRGHTKLLTIVNAKFIINKSGQDRVRRTGIKNVHAYVEGFLSLVTELNLPIRVKYDPYKNSGFIAHFNKQTVICRANVVTIGEEGIFCTAY